MDTSATIIPAWSMACNYRNIILPLIFHFDRGVQYASDRFRKKIEAYKYVKQSMSRKGNCWDNTVAESFFKSLKAEVIYPYRFTTRNQAKLAVFQYIEAWYNQNRRHSALGELTIKEFEKCKHLKQVA
jgi:transposase InsO family protein